MECRGVLGHQNYSVGYNNGGWMVERFLFWNPWDTQDKEGT